MSILAEAKRKQKWCLNPRGNVWSDDSNKFGQKMLEKMGWTSGKGLGPKENGMTQHVKVTYKNDSRGMGFKETDTQWTEHEDKFTELLRQFNDPSEIDQKKEFKSLEKVSQKSKVRVHYHKYTRGKDLSRYSEKDLANIFGRKSLEKKVEPKVEIQDEVDNDRKYGVQTIKGGSMVDYFKKKLPIFSKENGIKVEDEKPSYEFGFTSGFKGFELGIKAEPSEEGNNEATDSFNESVTEKPKKSKKKRKLSEPEEVSSKKQKFQEINNEEEIQSEEVPQKKCKKKKKKTIPEDSGFSNLAFDLNSVDSTSNPFEVKPKKKKSKRKNKVEDEVNHGIDNPNFMENNTGDNGESNGETNGNESFNNLTLNVAINTTPITPSTQTPIRAILKRRKSVRFSDVNEERIIPSNYEIKRQEALYNKNELFEINTCVIERGLEEKRKKNKLNKGFSNEGFDIKSIDSISFYESQLETKVDETRNGFVNVAYNNIQEHVDNLTKNLETYQAEVENDINEMKEPRSKKRHRTYQDTLV